MIRLALKQLRSMRAPKVIVLSLALVIGLTTAVFEWLLYVSIPNEAAVKPKFYRDPDGMVVADIRGPSGYLKLPFTRLTGGTNSAKTWVWADGIWQETNLLTQYRWGPDVGFRAVVKVPESKWKIRLWATPQRTINFGSSFFVVTGRSKLILSAEFPARREIERVRTDVK